MKRIALTFAALLLLVAGGFAETDGEIISGCESRFNYAAPIWILR